MPTAPTTTTTHNANGSQPSETLYKPFGEVRFGSGTLPTKYTFTGQYSNVSDFGLMYYNARFYAPLLSRFTSADTLIPEPGNPQSWDRFAYVNNSPLMYTDPSGHVISECGLDNQDCGASQAQIAYETQRYYYENCASGYGGGCPNYGEAVAFAAVGLVMAGAVGATVEAGLVPTTSVVEWSTIESGTTGIIGQQIFEQTGYSLWPSPWDGRQIINGINYSIHALERMMPAGFGGRGIPPSVIENVLTNGLQSIGSKPDTIKYTLDNIVVVWNYVENIVVTVWRIGH